MKKRSFTRYNASIKAHFFIQGSKNGWGKCLITKISRKGMGLRLYSNETITEDALICVKVFTTTQASDFFTVKGKLKWLEKDKETYICGIELFEILNEMQWLQLIYFIDNSGKNLKCSGAKRAKGRVGTPSRINTPPSTLEQIKSILNYKII